VKLREHWKSTKNGKVPSGHKRVGTFRDVSLVRCDPKFIEAIDLKCIELSKPRSEVVKKLASSMTAFELLYLPADSNMEKRIAHLSFE
jgi:hypothetical protein